MTGTNRTPLTNPCDELQRLVDVVASAPSIDGERLPILIQLRTLQQMLGRRPVEPSVEQFEVKMKAARVANGLHLLRVACTCPSDTELDPRCFVAFPHPWHAVKSGEQS